MANPNIANVTDIRGVNSLTSLTSTSSFTLLSNAASSNKVFKLNTVIAANVQGTSVYDVTIRIHNAAAGGGTAFPIASTINIPADASLIIFDKDCGIYILENQSVTAVASAGNVIVVAASWEEIA
jgi:hypothetical protein